MDTHVLLIDDDAFLRRSLSFGLAQAGYRVSTTADAEDAVALVTRDSPDLILSPLDNDHRGQCRHIR